jgi:hypothetical protein
MPPVNGAGYIFWDECPVLQEMHPTPCMRKQKLQQHLSIGLLLAIQLFVLSAGAVAAGELVALPQGFVYLDAVIPDLRLDLRY